MPTDTDVKIAEDLADFRLEAERRFGSIEAAIADSRLDAEKRFSDIGAAIAGSRLETEKRFGDANEAIGGIRTELRWIKGIGASLIAILIAIGAGSARVIWDAATVASDVRQQAQRLDKVEKRLDGIDAKLDVLVRRGEAKAKGE